MYVIIAPIQIKEGFKDQFMGPMLDDARGSVNDEPGCLRFDVIQDAGDSNRIWLYEVYKDEAAFQAHTPGAPLPAVEGRHQGHAGARPLAGRHQRVLQYLAHRWGVEVASGEPGRPPRPARCDEARQEGLWRDHVRSDRAHADRGAPG